MQASGNKSHVRRRDSFISEPNRAGGIFILPVETKSENMIAREAGRRANSFMVDLPQTYLRLQGVERGPFTVDQLRELADGGAITPATEAATDKTGPWAPLETFPQSEGLFPAPRQFQFKQREIEKASQPQLPSIDHRELIAAANRPLPPRTSAPAPAPPNDVVQILQSVARKQAMHEAPMEFKRRPNRRLRDFLLLMVPVNTLLIIALVWNGRHDPALFVFLVAAAGLLNAGAAWIIFFIMGR